MAKITLGSMGTNRGFDFARSGETDFFDYDYITTPTSTYLKNFQNKSNYSELKGTGLSWGNWGGELYLKGGAVTELKHVEGGTTIFSMTGLKIGAKAFGDAMDGGNGDDSVPMQFVRLILSGNDQITGTKYADCSQ